MSYPTALLPTTPPQPSGKFPGLALVNSANDWFGALKSCWAGTTPPSAGVLSEGMLWLDTSNVTVGKRLKIYVDGQWRILLSDFGSTVADCDTAVTDGNFVILTTTANSPFFGRRGALLVLGNGGPVTQIATNQNADEGFILLIRTSQAADGSSWTPWRRVFTQADVVGTVSMSGGVPSGAILQRGSNSNGRYTRYADGTQRCRVLLRLNFDTIAYLSAVWTLPAAFVNTDWIGTALVRSWSVVGPSSVAMVGTPFLLAAPTTTQMNIALPRISGFPNLASGDTAFLHLSAEGYWA